MRKLSVKVDFSNIPDGLRDVFLRRLREDRDVGDASAGIPESYVVKIKRGVGFASNGAVYDPEGKLVVGVWRAPRAGKLRIRTEKAKGPLAEFEIHPRTYLEWVRPKRFWRA